MKKAIILVIMLLPVLCVAQNVKTSNIQWNSQRTFNVSSGEWTEEITTLTTNASNSIEWKNADGSIRKTFQVVEAIGEWSNATAEGKIQFEVTDGQTSGTISIQRKNQETKVLMVMASEPPTLYELAVQTIQQL